jgi:SRSO17 transposase
MAAELAERLEGFWRLFRRTLRTKTRDTSHYALAYLSGILRMDSGRHLNGISRVTEVDKQGLQHFISQSPWSGRESIALAQDQMTVRPELQEEAMLLLDDSGEERSGKKSAGVAPQYLGRLGKVEQGQVSVFLSLVKGKFWSWVDGELYLPQRWFSDEYADLRQAVGIPQGRTFMTKADLGLVMLERVRAQGLKFEAVGMDGGYGHDGAFREKLDSRGFQYMADVHANQHVYLSKPVIGVPDNTKGKQATHQHVLSPKAYRVDALRKHPETDWQTLTVRSTERGELVADFAARRVWTVWQDEEETFHVREEWLVMRRDKDGKCYYSLSNAPADTPLSVLARRKCQRFFIERTNQEAKSDFGWDEIQTTKYRSWEHHLALNILAAWFIAETKLDWAVDYSRDPQLLAFYELEVLPTLSVANIRALLRAALPLPQLTPEQAIELVVEHLDNRARSRRSRLKNRPGLSPG